MDTGEIIIACILLFVEICMIGMGLSVLFPSPCIFRMDRKKNSCTLEKKFFWQEKYKIKSLCKLSEVVEAIRKGGDLFSSSYELCLKLKSKRDIVIFSKPTGRLTDPFDFDSQAKEINHFLRDKDEQYETIQKSFSPFGIFFLLLGSVLFFYTFKEIVKIF